MPSYKNSLEKITQTYFAGVCSEPFTSIIDGKEHSYSPKDITVSPMIFRGYTCPPLCGGCCPKFSLEYIPPETERLQAQPNKLNLMLESQAGYVWEPYTVFIKSFKKMYHDAQDQNKGYFCKHLNMETGRCGIHGAHPFHCDFELLRFLHGDTSVTIMQRLYGRGWNLKKIDGERGALCEMIPYDPVWHSDLLRRLKRLKEWVEYFEIEHKVDEIIEWCESGPHEKPLKIQQVKGR